MNNSEKKCHQMLRNSVIHEFNINNLNDKLSKMIKKGINYCKYNFLSKGNENGYTKPNQKYFTECNPFLHSRSIKQNGDLKDEVITPKLYDCNNKNILRKKLLEKQWIRREDLYIKYFEYVEYLKKVENPSISIIVISWRFIEDTLHNFEILNRQKDQNYELIFVDNGGRAEEFKKLKPFIDTYVRLNQNKGAYLARNIGALFSQAPIFLS